MRAAALQAAQVFMCVLVATHCRLFTAALLPEQYIQVFFVIYGMQHAMIDCTTGDDCIYVEAHYCRVFCRLS